MRSPGRFPLVEPRQEIGSALYSAAAPHQKRPSFRGHGSCFSYFPPMNITRLLLPTLLLVVNASALTISNFKFRHEHMYADVTWNPTEGPGAYAHKAMEGVDPNSGIDWFTINGGVATLEVLWALDGFQFRIVDRDLDGHFYPPYIDLFTVAFDPWLGWDTSLNNTYVASSPYVGDFWYMFTELPGNPNGFKIERWSRRRFIPDGGSMLTLLVSAILPLILLRRRFA